SILRPPANHTNTAHPVNSAGTQSGVDVVHARTRASGIKFSSRIPPGDEFGMRRSLTGAFLLPPVATDGSAHPASSAALRHHSPHVLAHGGFRNGQFILGAEHDEFRSCRRRGNVSRWHVEGVARLDDLLALAVSDGETPGGDVAPV